jgi:protein-tyrosine-phosphatase
LEGLSEKMAEAARERPQAVLFLCGHNQVRSPIAAALAKHLLGGSIYAASAGVSKGETDPFVTAVMDEIGIDLSRHKSVSLDEIEEYEGLNFDLVVSLSPEAHHRALDLTRRLPFEVEYWPIPDPTGFEGSREQRLDAYRAVRDELLKRIKTRFTWRPAGSV